MGTSLRTKIMRLALIPTVIMLVAVSGVTYIAYQRTSQQIMREQYGLLAAEAAARLSESLAFYGETLQQLAQEEDLRSATNIAQYRQVLERWGGRLYPFDAGVAVVNARGVIAWSQPLRFDWIGHDLSQTECFRATRDGEPTVFADTLNVAAILGDDVTMVGVPFLNEDGLFGGMLAGVFHISYSQLSPMYAEVLKIGISHRSYVYIVDRTGRVIYHPDTAKIGEDWSALPAVQRALRGESGAMRQVRGADDDLVLGYAPVAGAQWGLVVQEDWARSMAPMRSFIGFLLAALLIGLLVPLALVYVGVDRLTRPLAALALGAERIARGEFSHTVTVHSGDELQRLSHQFNVMARRLSASYANLETKVAERTRELATLNAVAATISESLELEAILNGVLDQVIPAVGVRAGGIYLQDPARRALKLAAQHGIDPAVVQRIASLPANEGLLGRVVQSGEPLALTDISADPRLTREVIGETGMGAVAIVPVQSKGATLGALFVSAYTFREFTPDELKLLTAIGQQVGIGAENARLFAEEQRQREEAMALAEVADMVSGNLDIDEMLQQAAERVARILKADRCAILMRQNGTGLVPRACCRADQQTSDNLVAQFERHPLHLESHYPFSQALSSLAPILIADLPSDPGVDPALRQALGPVSAMLLTPIYTGNRALGLLYLDIQQPNARSFSERDRDLAMALCNEIAVALDNARLFADLERRNAELSALNAIGTIVNESLVLDQILSDTLSKTLELLGGDMGEVLLLEPRSSSLVRRAQQGFQPAGSADESLPLKDSLARAIHQGAVVILEHEDPELAQYWAASQDVRSLAILPLRAQERAMGVMVIASRQERRFTRTDITLLHSVGNQLGIATENARLFERERMRGNQLRIINQIGQRVAAILSLNELLPFVARTLQEAFGYYNVNIFMLDPEARELVLRACAGAYAACLPIGHRLKLDSGVVGRVAQTARPTLVRDFSQEPHYCSLGVAATSRPGVVLPIKLGGQLRQAMPMGALEVQSAGQLPLGDLELGHLQTLADQIAIAIENARLYEQSRDLAIVEERTRLARELHDSVTQSLFSIVLNAETAGALVNTDPDRSLKQIQRLQEVAQDALAEMRSLIYELRPPSLGQEDLESALRRYVDVVQKRYHLTVDLRVSGERPLTREVEQALYRIAQEAVNNVIKHAQAKHVSLELALEPHGVALVIEDDGVGFDLDSVSTNEKHFGLGSMRDRTELLGGIFEITSAPGSGSRVHVDIPLSN